ncbi:MAG TPA: DUF5686 family protein [Bacteroidota bacterium]|nr:DUF5686 family protein [Bacteroidota bacterium]
MCCLLKSLALLCGVACLAHATASPSGPGATVGGTVRDAATGEPLAAANVRLLGTSRGTITNSAGEYSLSVDTGSCRLLFTMIGYSRDTIALRIAGDAHRDVRMQPSAIVLPEVLATPEDPAIGIIRRAIDNKQRWIDRLRSYAMNAFTRMTIYRDTAIAAILESYTRGYWRAGDTLREVVTQRRQTSNVAEAVNLISVGRILNFMEDEINLVGFSFVGPTARNALDYYDYKLVRTRTSGGNDIFEIRMIPLTRMRPLFEGTVMIAGGTYALVGVDLTPNQAFQIPLVKDLKLRYRQEFSLYESSFWMPSDIRIDASARLAVPGMTIPPFAMVHTSVISDYDINSPLPDSVFGKPRITVDSTAVRFDSTYWARNVVLPLDSVESRAYRTLDSTQSLEMQFKPNGVAFTLADIGTAPATLISSIDFAYNRVEGLHLGLYPDIDTVTERLSLRGGWAYGLSDRLATYGAGFTWYTERTRTLGIGGDVYRSVAGAPDHGFYAPLTNAMAGLFGKEDYGDYYRAEGEKAFITVRHSPVFRWRLTYTSERESPMPVATSYSFAYRSEPFRLNPAAEPGRMGSLTLDARIGNEQPPLDFVLEDGLDVTLEHASPSLTGGNFDFTRYDAELSLTVPTFAQSFLFKPGFRLRAMTGGSWGDLPVQRRYAIESTLSGGTMLGAMYGLHPRQYTGTGYASVVLEHNFRSLPFLALGIPFLYENGIELIVFGGVARPWGAPAAPGGEMHGTYGEAGFGISRILQVLRVDFAWRLVAPRTFYFALNSASFL